MNYVFHLEKFGKDLYYVHEKKYSPEEWLFFCEKAIIYSMKKQKQEKSVAFTQCIDSKYVDEHLFSLGFKRFLDDTFVSYKFVPFDRISGGKEFIDFLKQNDEDNSDYDSVYH